MLKLITIFLFIIVTFFSFSEVYGELEGTKMFCDELGALISENQKSCILPTVRIPEILIPDNYNITRFNVDLEFPTTLDFVGDDMLVLEKHSGKVIRLQVNGDTISVYVEPVLDVPVRYNFYSGLLGIATTPDHVFLYYTESESGVDTLEVLGKEEGQHAKNRVYQYDWDGENLTNPVLIKEFIAQQNNDHHGGVMTTGLNNEVYFTIGDQGQSGIFENVSDDICYLVDFTANRECTSEPIYETSSIFKIDTENDNNVELFAMGIRNSFGLDVDPVTGYLWDTENGLNYFDEVNLVKPRFNSGWKSVMGPADRDNPDMGGAQTAPPPFENFVYSDPEFSWYETVGPTAIAIPERGSFGVYSDWAFVGDYHYGNIWKFQLNSDRTGFVFSDTTLSDLVLVPNDSGESLVTTDNAFVQKFNGVSDIKFHNNAMYVVSIVDGDIYRISPEISIPVWIKNNAGWWAEGAIDDSTYVSALQWLISNGIMSV